MPASPDDVRRELNALTYITGKLDDLSTSAVVRVLSWAKASDAGSTSGDKELNAMRAVANRLSDITDGGQRRRILRWLDEHYLADDAEPGETVNSAASALEINTPLGPVVGEATPL